MSDISVTKFRKGTATAVLYPTLPTLDVQPRRADLYQKQYTHDILILEYPSESTLWFETLHTGVPIQFTWTQDTLTKYWVGYVSSVSKQNSPQRLNAMKVLCVGSSFPLKERTTRMFSNTTIPKAVQTIASEFGFNYIGLDNDQVFSQLTIPGQSYWDWIQEQAQRIGYGVIVDGMNFTFLPLDQIINLGIDSTAIFSLGNAGSPFNTQFLDRTLDMFVVTSGDNIEDTTNFRTVKNTGGVDPVTGKVYTASKSPAEIGVPFRDGLSDVLFSEFRNDRVVNDLATAKAAATGAAQMARFNLPATVQGQGDPRVRPFSPVFISGTGNLTDGFWIVRESHHMFHQVGDYQLDLKIATDGVGDNVETPFRTSPKNNFSTVNLDQALKNNGVPSLYFDIGSVFLYKKPAATEVAAVVQSSQGFNKTPVRWKAVGI